MAQGQARRTVLALLAGLGLGLLLGRDFLAPHTAAPVAAAPAAAVATAAADAKDDPATPKAQAELQAQAAANLDAVYTLLGEWLPGLLPAAPPDDGVDYSAERVLYDQHRLVDAALAALRPQTRGKTDLYVVAFAGDGGENVFRNETEYVDKLFSQRFDAAGRVVVLQNNPHTVEQRPLATWSNLELVLDGLLQHNRFDPDEDILLLFMTSHGDEDHYLYVGMDDLPLDWIGADDLAHTLNARPFRWKVNIISACYSGGFVDALKNSTSMVITAARRDRTSFGCGAESDITYFGDAFLVQGLNQTDSFRGAFEIARQLIAEWEERDKQTPSEPQIASTPLIEAKLADWRRGIRLGPPQSFQVAGAAQSSEKSTKE